MPHQTQVHVETVTLPACRFHEDPFPPLQRTGRARVYPYPMQDDLTDELTEQDFTAVVLENGLVRVTVLPDLGGHVLSLRDLVNDREVFYRNVPLKFGLIALRGAWWASGIEFNFPQAGHNVTTSDSVSWHVREEDDGSATLFVGTIERLTRMAWTVGIMLRPDDCQMHVRVWTCNRTALCHRGYFWSNTAVPARDDFRLLLPATQAYSWWYGADGASAFPMSKGRDLSRYTTHRRAADLFAKDLRADWFGCYYDDLDCGVLHQASRFDVHGRKLFTWGCADDGKAWAELLNGRAEPYVEIQSGHFVHQGVHRLMAPHSVETWWEAWSPVWGIGGVLHAAKGLALNADRDGDTLTLRLLALVPLPGAGLLVRQNGEVLVAGKVTLSPGETGAIPVALRGRGPVSVVIGDREHFKADLLVDGDSVRAALDAVAPHTAVPDRPAHGAPATPQGWLLSARDQEERSDLDAAADSYRKALDLDPQCTPAMSGLAQWHLKRSEAAKARDWAHKALQIDPQNEDALWWLGVASLLEPGSEGDATAGLHALRRNPRYAASASVLLGELALRRREFRAAGDLFVDALTRQSHDSRTWALAAFAARKGGTARELAEYLEDCEDENPLEPLLWSERYLSNDSGDAATETAIGRIFGKDPQLCLEAACDYEQLGAWDDVVNWLDSADRRQPMVLYHLAWAFWQLGEVSEALALVREASERSPLFASPHRHEDAQALQAALRLLPDDPLAHELLGNWLASVGRWDEGLGHWTRAAALAEKGEVAVVAWRNIGLAQWHRKQKADEALTAYGRALDAMGSVPPASPLHPAVWRLWLERDTVLAAQGRHGERIAAFESAPDKAKANFQILARWADACLRAGKPADALDILSRCAFKPWEGEMRSRRLWKETHMQLGHQARAADDLAAAREHFEAAADYPRHLGVGKPDLTDDADALFWAGWCAAQAGDPAAAHRLLTLAANEHQPRNAPSAELKARAADLLKTLSP